MAPTKPADSKVQAIVYPTCVRHLKSRKDVRLRHFFLCDECSELWTIEAFDGNKPLYEAEELEGYCLLCNQLLTVRMRTWFLCDVCNRVAGSIGKNHVAERAIMDFWKGSVQSRYPNLKMRQNDISSLRPRRDTDQTGLGPLDFLIEDLGSGQIVLGAENKTGRSSIKEMSQFQLDLSDCDSILNHVRELDIPAYIIHAQVLENWHPPTLGFRCVGLWWTDIYSMSEHFSSIRMRRDERRGAAFYRKKAFLPIETLPDQLFNEEGDLTLVKRYQAEGLPNMYVQN